MPSQNEWNEDEKRLEALHHPFTAPFTEDLEDLATARSQAYDMVYNGLEIGGGSVRIFQKDIQEKVFQAIGLDDEEAQNKFGFLMNAFEYGAPPHGGIALGFDRLCAIFGGQDPIRDFIAFPKNNSGRDMMIDAPSPVDQEQLEELNLEVSEVNMNEED